MKLIPVNQIRQMLRVLHGGGTIITLLDRPMAPGKGIKVRFFGRNAYVPAGPAVLAMKTGATLLPIYLCRLPDLTFTARILPAIGWTPSGDRDTDIQVITQKVMDTLKVSSVNIPISGICFDQCGPPMAAPRRSAQRLGNVLPASQAPDVEQCRAVLGSASGISGLTVYPGPPGSRPRVRRGDRCVLLFGVPAPALPPIWPSFSPFLRAIDVRAAARGSFQTDAKNWVDTLRIGRLRPEAIEALVDVHGYEHLEDALAQGRGVIVVSLHLGNYDLVGQVMAARGCRLTVPAERVEPEQLFSFLMAERRSQGINVIPIERAPERCCGRCGRGSRGNHRGPQHRGQKPGGRFWPARHLSRGPAALVRHSTAPVLMAVGLRLPGTLPRRDQRSAVLGEDRECRR
jgi:lauroyl/myristoyl acyltransferase